MNDFNLNNRTIGDYKSLVIELPGSMRSLSVRVSGVIGNFDPSTKTGKAKLKDWKKQVTCTVKKCRGDEPWDPSQQYAITLGLQFCLANHPSYDSKLDVDNYIKPINDALAVGLFGRADDSNFKTLLVYRLPDATHKDQEGVAIYVSAT